MTTTKSINPAVFIVVLLLFCMAYPSVSQVVINEVCTHNGFVLTDEDNDESDWFELYNKSAFPVSLLDFFVTDAGHDEWYFPDTSISPGQYVVVFASGKGRHEKSLHTSFRLSKEGDKLSLFNVAGKKLDEIVFGYLQLNHTAGRFPDGDVSAVHIFNMPTPGAGNNASAAYSGYADEPVFLHQGGFYQGNPTLAITVDKSIAAIHYTLDGSLPSDTSLLYTEALELSKTSIIRARAFSLDPMVLPSEIITNTYILNYVPALPVISIATEPGNLWDWNHGIYVMGPNADSVYPYLGANFWQDWEVPAHFEFFETDGKLAFKQDAGLSINGGSVSRTRPQQSFRITARNRYGRKDLDHRIFEEKTIDKFKCLVLRNSSGDFNKTHFRDGSLHKLMLKNKLDIDLLCYRPAVIYLNGEYWGILNIRERFSKYYLQENYHVDPDNVDLLEEDSTVIEGDFKEFNAMYDFVTQHDMGMAQNYAIADSLIDLPSFCDYFIAETFLSNIDWPYNNIKYWRVRAAGSKWRYLLMDLDISLGNYGWAPAGMDVLGRILGPFGDKCKHVQIFRSLLMNKTFREYFINRYADLVNTVFSTETMLNHITGVKAVLEADMPRHFEKWGSDMAAWNIEINKVVVPYIEARPAYALQFVQDTFHLVKEVSISLDVWPPGAGSVKINTIQPWPLPWTGTYFDGVPVQLTAMPNPGFRFVQWQASAPGIKESERITQNLNVDTNTLFTAYFNLTARAEEITVFPNPAGNVLNLGFVADKDGHGRLCLYNVYGQEVQAIETNYTSGPNYRTIETTSLTPGLYYLHIKTQNGDKSAKLMISH